MAAAAALLLIVVIFVVSRSSDSNTNKSTGSTDTEQAAGSFGSTAPGGTTPTGTKGGTTAKPQAKWTNGLAGSPKVFRAADGSASSDPQPGKDAKPGVYFWESYDGWHVRVVKGDGVDKVDGIVTGLLKNQGAKIVKVTGADASVAKAEGGNVSFQVPPGGSNVVGIDFTLDAFTTNSTLTLNGDNGSLDVSKIYLGAWGEAAHEQPGHLREEEPLLTRGLQGAG